MSLEAKGEFREAARDYRLLLDRGYSGQATLKLVGDRHRLQAEERLILFRGIASAADSELRRAKLRKEAEGGLLLLDAYNQAFGIVHYLLGKPCFIATDGLLRDAGANYGRVPHDELLLRAFAELALGAARCGVARVEAFLDAPVSRSAEHAQSLEAAFESAGLTLFGVAAGGALGFAVAMVLIRVVNPQSFHWRMDLSVPWGLLASVTALLLAAGVGTALLATRRATGVGPLRAVREDW